MLEINNYGDLKKSVQTWLNRKDQSTIDNIPIFINFAEKMFTRLIKLPYYETSYIVVWDEGKGFVQLPSDFLSMKHIYVGDSILTRVDLENYIKLTQKDKNLTKPKWFTRVGSSIQIFPSPSTGDTVNMIYYKDIPEMTNETDAPYSLITAPEIFLYLSLRHAAIFLRDNDQEQYWMSKATESAESLKKLLDEVEWSGSSLVVSQFDEV